MGFAHAFEFASAEEIWDEVREVWTAGRGMSYQRLDHGGLQWPCPEEDHPGTQILHTDTFPSGKTTRLQCLEFKPSAEHPNAEFPFILTTGRSLFQYNAGTMTMRTANRLLRPADTLDLSPVDAERLMLKDGDDARIVSRHGSAVLPVRIGEGVKPHEVFATFHSTESGLNSVIGTGRDDVVMTPEYKVAAVRIEKIGGEAR
jgi:formate dehydrogenase major subunit